MSKEIVGTDTYGKGAMILPTAVDFGNTSSKLYNDLLTRLALHDHSNDGAPVALPSSAAQKFPNASLTFTPNGAFYSIAITFASTIKVPSKNLGFYFKASTDPDTSASWIRFYPSYHATSDTAIVIDKFPLNTVDFMVVA